jgi:predicted dehydrogenase
MGNIGVALVGAGYWGRRVARNLAAADRCELRVICDVDRARACEVADAHGGAPVVSLDAVLADDAVEAVVVATPSSTHTALVTDVIAASRHVLVEKPLAGSPADAARLATSAAERGVVVMCDQTYRFAPAVATIRTLLADPGFGPVARIESCRTNHGHDQPDVDVFWDLAYHDLAVIDAVAPGGLCGGLEVQATTCDAIGRGRPHRGELVLEATSGPTATITVDWHAEAKVRAMRFVSADHEVTWDDVDGPDVRLDGVQVPVAAGEPLAAVITEFLAAIADGRPAACGPAQELPILTMLTAASESAARAGAPVA